jgi:hypothetical protein
MSGGNPQGGNQQYRPNPQYAQQPAGYPPQAGYPNQQPPQNPYGVPGQNPYLKPHRGGMLLAFGICGFAVCVIFGIIAFFMAKTDLAEMRAGTMDRTGEGLTKAGYYCGMISMIVTGAIILLYAVIFGVLAASGGFR